MPLARSGKENVRPSTNGVKNERTAVSRREGLRKRPCLTSNDDRKKTTHPVSDSFPAKKTPFHVHCDERNVVRDPERSKISNIIYGGYGAKRREQYAAGSTQTDTVGETKEKKLLPSRIPRQFRSCICAPNTGSQGQTRRSPSVELKTIRPEERCCKAADLKFGWNGGRVVMEQSKLKSFAEEARGVIKKPVGDTMFSKHLALSHKKLESIRVRLTTNPVEIRKSNVIDKHSLTPINRSSKMTVETARISRKQTTTNIFRSTRNSTIISNINRIGPRATDRIEDNLLHQESRGGAYNTALRPESNTETAVDNNIPHYNSLPITLQGAIRKTINVQRIRIQVIEETDSCQDYDYFPWQLAYYSEYCNEIPTTEYERERQSPKLSKNFLEKNVNAKLRRLIVIFILRLGATTLIGLGGNLSIDRQDLLKYELKILLTLNFNITFADPLSLFTYYLISCRGCITLSQNDATFIYHVGGYLIDLTLLDESLSRMSACLIALSAMELALGLTIDAVVVSARPRWLFWRGLLFTASPTVHCRFTGQAIDQMRITLLNRIITSAGEHNGFSVVYEKYSRSRFGRISTTLLLRVCRVSTSEMCTP